MLLFALRALVRPREDLKNCTRSKLRIDHLLDCTMR